MDLDIRQYLTKANEQQDSGVLQAAYRLLQDRTAAGTGGPTPGIAPEWYVVCAETALQLGCLEISTACLKMYFEGNPPANQFLCRAYLCQAQLKSPPATGNVEDFEEAVQCFLKAIEISKPEPRYHFIIFNASVLYFQTVRPLLQTGCSLHLVPSLRQVVQSLEEVADQDHSWRAELMMHLIKCLVDSGKMVDAASFAKVTEGFIKSHTPHLYPRLFMLLVHHKLAEDDLLIEMSRESTTLTVIYKTQEFKKLEDMSEDEQKKQELETILHLLVDRTKVSTTTVNSSPLQNPTPIQPADRVAFLLELALLALQVQHQKVAADCLKELKTAGEASIGQRIIMECVSCEINLLKKEAKMNVYSKASVEAVNPKIPLHLHLCPCLTDLLTYLEVSHQARLKEIGKLDHWLQTAVREGDPQAVQAVCATQWSFCLPLLQHNLRKYIKKPLLNVAQVLEDMQSMLLEMRCQVHSELAVIEEEEGCLEASLTHLQKAMLLDNGTQRERLLSALRLLQLRGTLYQTPSRTEDKAAMLMQQARDKQPDDKTDICPILVAVGLLLAPDDFQVVLDADNNSESSPGSGPVAQLSAKAQQHSTSVRKVDGYLARQGDGTDNTERVKLWATLVKTARKWEVWDVCRAACRFCLLYDDGRWKNPKTDTCRCSEEESHAECLHSYNTGQTHVRDLLRLLAEIHFISAEATVQKLRTEGVQLNSPAVPAVHGELCVSEEDPHWVVYSDWIQALSAYATSSFLRAAELGAEIREPWVVANAAIYLWNYSNHLLAAGEYPRLLPTFQSLVEIMQKTEYTGNNALFVLLCDAVARGLIQPLCGRDYVESAPPGDKGKNRAEKGMKNASIHGIFLDPAALQDVRKALELCDYALVISNGNIPGETVPIAARKQVVATWVQIKRLLQQQIGSMMDTKDECRNEGVLAMTRVLVGVEMFQCNRNPGHMEFSVPSLSTLVSMASECSWTDTVVELQVWCQLAAFCHDAKDHSLVLCCTKSALQLEDAASQSLNTMPCVLYGQTAVNEMMSSAACLRGLSLVHESNGNLHIYREAMKVLLSSVSYAEKAENPALCLTAVRHYWNTCLPLTQTPEERWQLQEPLEKILSALVHTNTKHAKKQDKVKSLTALPLWTSKHEAKDEEDLTLRAAIYSLLHQIHIDKAGWKSALQLLDKAIRDMPRTRHRLPLLKHRILVKARLGESVLMDMQKLEDEGDQCCSLMWHQVALCSGNITQQLSCYQKSITCLLSVETQWRKVDLLLKFGEWLYTHNFPKSDAQHQIQWAVDILLYKETEQSDGAEDESKQRDLSTVKCESLIGVQGSSFTQKLCSLKEVRHLDGLVRAHTLLALMADKTSPEHQLNLLRAYTVVLQIWKVSMAVGYEISSEMAKSQPAQPPPSAGSRKGKDKGKGKKVKDPPPGEERPKPIVLDKTLPSTPKDWACYICPDQARQIFRTNSNPHCINTHSITKQTRSLFYLNLLEKELHTLSLDFLTLPILHLGETIANDLLDRRSLSDLYRLRIVRTCCRLGLETYSPYQEQLLSLSRIQEEEQMGCRKAIALSQERRGLHKAHNQEVEVDEKAESGQQSIDVCAQDIWLDKAEVCLSMGLYQPARQLLAEAHFVSMELGDQTSMARSLLSLAILACEEQNYVQALILLNKAQALGGDEEFWYQFTLTKVRAVVDQKDHDPHQGAHTKADQIIKQGCGALKLVLEQRVNRVPELTFLITSLEMRGAIECIHAFCGGEPGETLSTEVVQRLMAACDTLRECASSFTKLSYREQAAEAHVEYAHALRILASHATDREDKQRFLLDGLSQMQQAVTKQEHVVLNAQRLLPSQEESHRLSLAAMQRLLRLRLTLAEFCLAMLEEHCAEKKRQALAREGKTPAEIALEEFTRCTPEPDSIEQEWLSVGSTLGQVALGQLATVSSYSLDSMETKACCLSLTGKYLRLLAAQEDPIYLCALWERHKQKGAWSDPKTVSVEKEDSGKEKDRGSSRRDSRVTSAKSAELQKRRHRAQQLLAQASKALVEAISLCLQHRLPSSILADASLNMLECHGQSDPAAAGQYLALFQSCCTVATMAEVLSSACADTSASQLSALLSLHRKLLISQDERPSSMLKGVEDSLSSLSKAFSHLTVYPGHLNILAELPPSLKILLLQHSEDGSELYGAFYEVTKAPNQKGKTTQVTGALACSRVAKVSVCPKALLALREQTRAFGRDTRHVLLKEARHEAEGRLEASEEHQNTAAEETLAPRFREIVQNMEDYLNPLLTQFDFSCLRPPAASLPVTEVTKTKDKEEKGSSGKAEAEEYVVLLADQSLLRLPLEALSILQQEGLSSVSRDFSLQLLHNRLNRDEPVKVESDNKKETKGGKGTKGKVDQSQAIKAVPVNRVVPSNTFPVDTRNIKYVVDPHNKGNFDGTSLSVRMKEMLETHSQHFTHLWEGFMGSKQKPSLSEMEQLLCRCSAFIYLGMEHLTANIPPAKLAAFNLSECRMALLFNLVQNNSSLDTHKRAGQLALEKPLEIALLLSLCGVGCIILNQWHSSLQLNTHNMDKVLDNLLRVRLTSGQTIHALRRGDSSELHRKVAESYDQVLVTDSNEDDAQNETTLTPSAFSCILYGLPNLIVT